jgi:transposase
MRYELSDFEWTAIKPMLPNKMCGVRRVNDRRVLNGILFHALRSRKLLNRISLIWVVQSCLQKYSASRFTQIKSRTLAVSPHERGVSRSSRTRGGMRWTRQRWARIGNRRAG